MLDLKEEREIVDELLRKLRAKEIPSITPDHVRKALAPHIEGLSNFQMYLLEERVRRKLISRVG